MSGYRVAVLGGGSVGLCLAAHFAEAGAQVSLLVRAASLDALTGQPIEVSGLLGDHVIPPGRIHFCDAARPDATVRASDMLVVTTKAQDVATALAPFAGQDGAPHCLCCRTAWARPRSHAMSWARRSRFIPPR